MVNPLGFRTTFGYDTSNRRISQMNPLGFVTTTTYDRLSRVEATINPLGRITTYGYDPESQLQSVMNPLGFVTTQSYDADNNYLSTQDPLGNITTFGYDLAGQPISVTNPLGFRTTYTYNGNRWRTAERNARGFVTTTVYEAAGTQARIATVDPLGFRTTIQHDAASRPIAVIDAAGATVATEYDPVGNATKATDGRGFATTMVYDARDLPTATIDPLGNRTTATYDALRQPRAAMDANGNVTTTVYDAAGQPRATIDALGHATTTVYDGAGQRTALVNARGFQTEFQYDRAGRPTVEIDPLGRRTTLAYDAAGRNTSKLDARNISKTFVLDAAGRLERIQYTNDPPVTFTYDAADNRRTMVDRTGTTTYAYDAVNQSTDVQNPLGKTVSYRYDARGQRAGMTEPDGGLFTYSYDPAGRIESLSNPIDDVVTFSYDAAGQQTRIDRHPINWLTTHSYDAAGQLTRIYHGQVANPAFSQNVVFTYTYDNVGNRSTLRESVLDGSNVGVVTWTYDNTYQLTREQRAGTNPYDVTHGYDAVGNRLQQIDNTTGGITTFAYDVANQLQTSVSAAGTTNYAYDAAGNLRTAVSPSGAIATNTWDDDNRRLVARVPTNILNTFTYNGDGQRVEKRDRFGITRYVWDGQNCLSEVEEGLTTTQALYTQTPDVYGRLISRKFDFADSSEFYEFDALGSTTRLIVDSTGTTSATYRYRAFGETTHSGLLHSPFAWIGLFGYYHDRDLLEYNLGERGYSVASARFLSWDPIGFAGDLSNPYRYAANNPINYVDPSGLYGLRQPAKRFQYVPNVVTMHFVRRSPVPVVEHDMPEVRRGYLASQLEFMWSVAAQAMRTSRHSWWSGRESCWTCEEVGVLQIYKQEFSRTGGYLAGVASLQSAANTFQWKLDKGFPYPYTSGSNTVSAPFRRRAQFEDHPLAYYWSWFGGGYVRRFRQDFELHFVCLAGLETGATYGGIAWGHEWFLDSELRADNQGILAGYHSRQYARPLFGPPSRDWQTIYLLEMLRHRSKYVLGV